MQVDPDTIQQLERLIQRGREMLIACGWNGREYAAFRPGGASVLQFRARTIELFRRTFGEGSAAHARLEPYLNATDAAERGYHLREFVDVLERTLGDCLRERVFAAPDAALVVLREDFLEAAEALVNAGCHLEAAERCGAVVRRLLAATARQCGLDPDQSALELNERLHEAGAYDRRACRRIAAILQLSRDASGCRAIEIASEDVADLVGWLRDFQRRTA